MIAVRYTLLEQLNLLPELLNMVVDPIARVRSTA